MLLLAHLRSYPLLAQVCSNPSGHKVHTNAYIEVFTSTTNMNRSNYVFKSIPTDGMGPGPLDGTLSLFPQELMPRAR